MTDIKPDIEQDTYKTKHLLDKALYDLFYEAYEAGQDISLERQFENDMGYKHRYAERCIKTAKSNLADLLEQLINKVETRANDFDKLADELVEVKYQLRVEHNHGDMKWYAYYAQSGHRKLFESDIYSSGEDDWKTASDTPTEAIKKLKATLTKEEPNKEDK